MQVKATLCQEVTVHRSLTRIVVPPLNRPPTVIRESDVARSVVVHIEGYMYSREQGVRAPCPANRKSSSRMEFLMHWDQSRTSYHCLRPRDLVSTRHLEAYILKLTSRVKINAYGENSTRTCACRNGYSRRANLHTNHGDGTVQAVPRSLQAILI